MNKGDKINFINIGLMLFSCAAAFVMPLEVFLFVYAILGPLHYLTEISWLHDRQYFTKGKYDHIVLWIIGALIFLQGFAYRQGWNWPFSDVFYNKMIFVALTGSLLLVFVKSGFLKVAGFLVILLASNFVFSGSGLDGFGFFIGTLVPTLIHVFVFTGFFILYGALKSRSVSGLISMLVFLLCPVLLFTLFRDHHFIGATQYGKDSYVGNGEGFFSTNVDYLTHLFNVHFPPLLDDNGQQALNEYGEPMFDYSNAMQVVFHSQIGVLVMRFIAFAYTYHYLNWFSKTEIIRWHKVPKTRFIAVVIIWILSIVLYGIDYALGLRWLFFLSFAHVLLEFPLNMISITGIWKEGRDIARNGFRTAMVNG